MINFVRNKVYSFFYLFRNLKLFVFLFVVLQIFWFDFGELVCIVIEELFFIFKYLLDKVLVVQEIYEGVIEDGIEDVFEVIVLA